MTTKIEKEFFDTFGIEPEKIYLCPLCKSKLSGCTWVGDKQRFECVYSWGDHPYYMSDEVEEKALIEYEYPEITDRILLELITFLADAFCGNYCIPDVDYINLKSYILCDCVNYSNKGYIKVQIKELFNSNP